MFGPWNDSDWVDTFTIANLVSIEYRLDLQLVYSYAGPSILQWVKRGACHEGKAIYPATICRSYPTPGFGPPP